MKNKLTFAVIIMSILFYSVAIGQNIKKDIKEEKAIPESIMNIPLPGPFLSPQETNANFATTVYTFGDITVFSYFDNTTVTVYDANGVQKGTQTLNTDKYYTFNYGSGVFRIIGNKTYTVLVGDAISSTVNGFFAVDEAGRGVSTKLNTWMSMQSFSTQDDFIVFAYENGTGFTVRNLNTGNIIAAGSLNAGEHYSFRNGVGVPWNTPLQVTGTKPVSALSYEDQDYYVPASNGTFVGTTFYGFSAFNGSWTNSITVTSYADNNTVTVKNTTTGATISTFTLQKGQVHVDPINTPTFWSVTSSGAVSVSNTPIAYTDNGYYYMTRAIDETGRGFGKLFYMPTIGSNIHVFSYENGNSVIITRMGVYTTFPYTSTSQVWTGTLDEGKYYNFTSTSGKYVYKIESTKNVAVIQSNGGAGADFVPLAYSLDYPDLAISTSDIAYSKADTDIQVGDLITVTVTVHNYGNVAASNVICYAYEGDPDAGGNAPVIGSGTISSIPVGGTGTFTFQYRVPTSPEYRFIVVKVDPTNQITESNESNNKATRSIKPNGDLLPPLAVTVTAPSSLTLSGGNLTPNPFTVKFDIFNTGTVTAGNVTVTLELFNGLTLATGTLVRNLGDIAGNATKSVEYSVNANKNISGFNLYKATITATNATAKVVNRSVNVPDGTPPAAPTNLAGQVTGNGAATFTWNNNSEADLAGYYLYYGPNQTTWNGTGAAQGNSPILVVGKNNLSITGMPTGTYYFMLKAFDTSNNLSNNSNIVQLNFTGQTTIQNLFYGNTAYTVTVSTDQGNWGYVAGTNSYADLGKYQRFDITQSARLIGAYFYFAGKTITGAADNFNVVVKQRNPDGSPGTTLYSQSYSTSVIDVTTPGVSHNYFAISPGINFTSPFFIGIEWGANVDDRFGLILDANNEGNGQKRAWEKWSDNTYHAMADAWNNMDRDIWIAAEVEVASSVKDGRDIIPTGYALNQNYPNPFNPSTVISYQLPTTAFVRLRVFDLLGNEIASLVNKEQPAGHYNIIFNGKNLSSGTYFYRLEAGNYSETKKLMLIK